ncbi:MAG: methyltransferase domain-containing protein, partial [Planctomycetes bacterium]|nr:methyltransferase domain-containing protein [Planctomycetota bacterium]
KLFIERQDQFDLFIYSEDDTLLTTRNLTAWIEVQPLLAKDQILGFLRYEVYRDGELSYCGVHYHYHWNPASVQRAGGEIFAHYTNEHSALSVLTRDQLKHCIASGGFDVPAHQGRYDMLVSAASDPYTQCGLQRLICVSRLDDFLLKHLPNVYLGRIGVKARDFTPQLEVIEQIADGKASDAQLFDPKVDIYVPREAWNKIYYAEPVPEYRRAMEFGARRILSVGCGDGQVEADWIAQGATVTGIPMDAIIAASAVQKGVEVLSPDLNLAIQETEGRLFDIVVFHQVLEYVPEPVEWLRKVRQRLADNGQVVVCAPNQMGRRIRCKVRKEAYPFAERASFGDANMHVTGPRILRGWLQEAGFRPQALHAILRGKAARVAEMAKGLVDSVLAEAIIQTGRKS